MLLSLPPNVNVSPDAVYSYTGDATNGYALTLSAGVASIDANLGAGGVATSLTVAGTATVSINSPETLTALTLSGTAKATVSSSGGGITGNLLDITDANGFSMPLDANTSLPTATLDMMDNDMILRGAGDAELPVLRTLLHSGLPSGHPGLRSSDVKEFGTSYTTRLGYGDGFSSFDGATSVDGLPVTTSDVRIIWTFTGDMNLDRKVKNNDFTLFSNHFGSSAPPAGTAVWTTGDFSYDGSTTNSDFTFFSNGYGGDITGPNFPRSIVPLGLPITATEGQPLASATLATFTDTNNATTPVTHWTDYVASVSWGDGNFVTTGVNVAADTDPADPGGFVVTASGTVTSPDALIVTEVQYAPGSSFSGRPASLGEPVMSVTPAVNDLFARPVSVSQINLFWTLNASNASAIQVSRADDGNNTFVPLTNLAGGSDTSYTDITVSEGHSYSYEIRALQSGNYSAYADPADATTEAVQGLYTTTPSATEIDLSWLNLSIDPNATLEVRRAPFSSPSSFTTITPPAGLPAGTTSYADSTGLTGGAQYLYQVLIHEPSNSTSAISDAVDAWTLPAAPSILTVASQTSSEVDLTWASVGSPAFLIERSTDGVNFEQVGQADPGVTHYADTTIDDGTSYVYQVVATNSGGNSGPSNATTAVTPLVAPSNLTAVTAPGPSDEIDLSWTNNSESTTGFIVERSFGGPFTQIAYIAGANSDAYQDTAVQFGAVYTYEVIAFGPGSTSSASNTAPATTLPTVSLYGAGTVAEDSPYVLTPVTAYGSANPPFPVTGWSINWGDGVTESLSGPGPFQHAYKEAAFYSIGATALTADGGVQNVSGVRVVEAPIVLGLPAYSLNGSATSYTLPLTFENPGNETVTNWIFDWGDGNVVRTSGGAMPSLSHSYAHPGGYSVEVTALTDEGAYHIWANITIPGSPPRQQPGPNFTIYLFGQGGYLSGQAAMEGGNAASEFLYTGYYESDTSSAGLPYTVDWGDNSGPQSGVLDAKGQATPTHVYAEQGNYTVVATAGGSTARDGVGVGDNDTYPTLAAIPDQTVAAGDPVDISATATGLDTDGPSAAFIDWGDGRGPQRATLTGSGATATVTAHFDHAPPGTRQATAWVADESSTSISQTFYYTGTLASTLQANRTGLNFGHAVSADDQHSSNSNNFVILTDNGFGVDPEGLQQNDQLPTAPIVNGQIQTGTDGKPIDTDLSQLTLSKLPDSITDGVTYSGNGGEVSIEVAVPTTYTGPAPLRFFDSNGRLLPFQTVYSNGVPYSFLLYDVGDPFADPTSNPLGQLTSHSINIWMQGVAPCSGVSVSYTLLLYPNDNAEGQVAWQDYFYVNVAELANRATSNLMTQGPSSAQVVDSAGVPDSAKFQFTLAGLGSQNAQVSLKAPGDSGQGQSASLLNGSFNVYYAPDGTDQPSGPDPTAVRFDPGTDNGSGNILATVSTLKDQFSRVIEGAPESFYYDAFVYNALLPGADPVTASTASPSVSPGADGAGDSDFLKSIAPADSAVVFPFTGDPKRDIQQQLGRAMLTNYQTLYGGYGQLLLQAFLEARDETNQLYHNFLTVWQVHGDSTVKKHWDAAQHRENREIVISDALSPVKAAQELYSDLSVLAGGGYFNMPAVGKTLGGIVGDYLASAKGEDTQGALDVYFKELHARVQQVSATAVWLASSYYKAIALVGEGANIIVALNDLGNGDITALLNFVPFLGKAVSETGVFSKIRLFGEDLSSTLSAAKCKLLGQGCLLAGTLVQTQDGLKPIEDVAAGEKVWSFNRVTGAWELEPVLATIQHPYVGDIVTLTAGGEDLSMTSNHPVWVVSGEGLASRPASAEVSADEQAPTAEGRWVAAGDVRVGDLLLLHSGQTAAVTGTSLIPEYTVVYNLTVDQTHDFAIGDEGVLVHNAKACDARTAEAIEKIWMDLFQADVKDGVYIIGGRKASWGSKAFTEGGVITLPLSDGRIVSVPFTKGGFPDFTNFLYQGGKNTVKITLTNNRKLDEAAANALAGYATTPELFTWHHSEQLGVMQLVDAVVNDEVYHTGGFAILKAALQQLGKTFNLVDASL